MATAKTIVSEAKVSCDGGGGPKGHPKVYLTFEKGQKTLVCPYCSHTFSIS